MSKVPASNNREVWDRSVYEASEEYKGRMVSFVSAKPSHDICVYCFSDSPSIFVQVNVICTGKCC